MASSTSVGCSVIRNIIEWESRCSLIAKASTSQIAEHAEKLNIFQIDTLTMCDLSYTLTTPLQRIREFSECNSETLREIKLIWYKRRTVVHTKVAALRRHSLFPLKCVLMVMIMTRVESFGGGRATTKWCENAMSNLVTSRQGVDSAIVSQLPTAHCFPPLTLISHHIIVARLLHA